MANAPVTMLDRAQESLRSAGLRATDQRVLVLSTLMSERTDSTAQSLYDRLRREHPSLGQATVYRTLAALAEAGLIDALQHGHGTCYRWCAPGHHHHLVCDRCHLVVELHDCAVGEWVTSVGDAHGFADVRHTVELTGTCATCTARPA